MPAALSYNWIHLETGLRRIRTTEQPEFRAFLNLVIQFGANQ